MRARASVPTSPADVVGWVRDHYAEHTQQIGELVADCGNCHALTLVLSTARWHPCMEGGMQGRTRTAVERQLSVGWQGRCTRSRRPWS